MTGVTPDHDGDSRITCGRDRVWSGDVPETKDIGEALPQLAVAPDGLCLDEEGAVWVADALNGRVLRVREGGEIVDEINADSGVPHAGRP